MFKKIYSVFVVIVLFCLIPLQSYSAPRPNSENAIYALTARTGDAQGSLQRMDMIGVGAPNSFDLITGDFAIVVDDTGAYFYRFDATATDAHNDPLIIRPLTYSTAGVWKLTEFVAKEVSTPSTDGSNRIKVLDNTTKDPEASSYEMYPEGGVWKITVNGVEYNILHSGLSIVANSLAAAYIDWDALSGGNSILNKPTVWPSQADCTGTTTGCCHENDTGILWCYNGSALIQSGYTSEAQLEAGIGVAIWSATDSLDQALIAYASTNYTPSTVTVGGHLSGIDDKLAEVLSALSAAGLNSFSFTVNAPVSFPNYVQSTTVNFDVDVTDTSDLYAVAGVQWQLDGGGYTSNDFGFISGNNWTDTITGLAEGSNTIQLRAYDDKATPNYGSSTTYTVVSDQTDPVVSAGADQEHDGTGPEITVSGISITETNESVRERRIYNTTDSTEVATWASFTGTSVAYTIPADTDNYQFQFRVSDLSGRTGTDNVDILYSTAPTVSTATIGTDGTTLTLDMSETVTRTGGTFDVDCVTAGNDITATYSSGSGSTSLVYTLGSTVNSGDTCDLDYDGAAGGIVDASANDLAAITSQAITNNSTQSAGGSASSATDDFNRAAIGTDWSSVTGFGSMAISASTIVAPAADTTDSLMYWSADTFSADQYSQAELAGSTINYQGPCVRVNAAGTGICAQAMNGATSINIYDMSDFSIISTISSLTFTYGDVIKLSVSGTGASKTLKVYIDGVQVGSDISTSEGPDTGQPGISGYTTNGALDNWEGGTGTGQDVVSNFDSGVDGAEISSLTEWTLAANGVDEVTIDTDGPCYEGAGCALSAGTSSGDSRYSTPLTISGQYAVLTYYLYIPALPTSVNYYFMRFYNGGTGLNAMALTNAGNITIHNQLISGFSTVADVSALVTTWIKVEIQIDSTNDEIYISLNDGAALGPYGVWTGASINSLQIHNNGTGSVRIDSITLADGGTIQ